MLMLATGLGRFDSIEEAAAGEEAIGPDRRNTGSLRGVGAVSHLGFHVLDVPLQLWVGPVGETFPILRDRFLDAVLLL